MRCVVAGVYTSEMITSEIIKESMLQGLVIMHIYEPRETEKYSPG